MHTHTCIYVYAYIPVAAFLVKRDANGNVRGEIQTRSPARRRSWSRDVLLLRGVDVAHV